MPPAVHVVLDTNAVLDWLVFRDPRSSGFAAAIEQGRLGWLASQRMRNEFDMVLARPGFGRWKPDSSAVAACWDLHANIVERDPPTGPLRCRDPDDQMFIDLALQERCAWLITRDQALLALRRAAQGWGLRIVTPVSMGSMVAGTGIPSMSPGPTLTASPRGRQVRTPFDRD